MCYNAGSLAKEVINSATMMRYLVNATQKILTSAASTRSKQSTSNSATPADASGPASMRSLRKSKRNLKLDKWSCRSKKVWTRACEGCFQARCFQARCSSDIHRGRSRKLARTRRRTTCYSCASCRKGVAQ